MEVVLGKKAGFCLGVTNTIVKAEKELAMGESVHCLGELVHNPVLIQKLQKKGLIIVQNINEVPEGEKVILRAHGVTKREYEESKKRNLKIIDLTCPKVLELHKAVENKAKEGYYILIIGEKEHPEVKGTYSFASPYVGVIEEQTDVFPELEKVVFSNKRNIAIFSQTTFDMNKFDKLVQCIKRNIAKQCNLEVNKTICDATKLRQAETRKIAKQVELMIIIGGKKSSNTTKLYQIAVDQCNNAMQVENLNDLFINYIRRFHKVGVMAGASTPDEMIQTVVKILEETQTEGSL